MDIKDLVGKTITAATVMHHANADDAGWLRLEFSDGTSCLVIAGYCGYTGQSLDEYPTYIDVSNNPKDMEDLIPYTT